MMDGAGLDDEFSDMVTHQIRLFLLAGNDTTSSTIVFMYHLLSKHPKVLLQLQKEHDEIFGPDASKAATMLQSQPTILNKCSYTLAVVKETLRIYPPATSMRQGLPGITLSALDGTPFPTEGFHIVMNHAAFHLNPRVWKQASEFLPERWLVSPGHELYPPSGAYRPFDIGPRICIGQTLSLNEMRIVAIMTARTFAIKPACDEFDQIQAQKASLWAKAIGWVGGKKMNTVGDRAYQTETAGTHPADGYPCRVSLLH